MKIKVHFTDNGFVVVKDGCVVSFRDNDQTRIDTELLKKVVGLTIIDKDLDCGSYGFELEIKVKPINKDIFQ